MKDFLLKHKKKIAAAILAALIALGAVSEDARKSVMSLVDMLPGMSEGEAPAEPAEPVEAAPTDSAQ